jgi:hypothetical protein
LTPQNVSDKLTISVVEQTANGHKLILDLMVVQVYNFSALLARYFHFILKPRSRAFSVEALLLRKRKASKKLLKAFWRNSQQQLWGLANSNECQWQIFNFRFLRFYF